MAKRKSKIELENIELKPQTIGYTYKKKSNLGRVIFIFFCFSIAIFYINDISVYINGLIGKKTSETISGNTVGNKEEPNNQDGSKKITYNVFSNNLVLSESGLVIDNFNYDNNTLTFDASNNSGNTIDLTNRKFYVEIYTESKMLIQRMKVDFDSINANSKVSFSFNVNDAFYYIVLIEKTIDDYPLPAYKENEAGFVVINCTKNIENLTYTFDGDKLATVKHTISDSNVSDSNYSIRYLASQNKASSYNTLTGVSATFNGTLNGYSYVVTIDLTKADMTKLNEKYYFDNTATPRIVDFEIQTYGFVCS